MSSSAELKEGLRAMSDRPRVLLIGLDGFSPDLTAQWIEQGHLPHLAMLQEQGYLGALRGVTPPVTYPAWTTCVTGVNPGRHGITDFTISLPGNYGIRFLNSTDRQVPALWNILSSLGKRVCILGVPATYPPEAVNGIMLSGFDSPVADRLDPSYVYPPELFSQVSQWPFSLFQEHRISSRWYEEALALLEKKIAVQEEIGCRLLQQEAWDLFMIVLNEADTVSHHFWQLEDTASPRHDPEITAPDSPILRIYRRLDEAVGRFIDAFDDPGLVLVVSDHGFGGAGVQALHINNYLEACGWLSYKKASQGILKKAALRWVPMRLRGTLFRRFQRLVESLESRARRGGIQWDKTRAWSDELDYCPAIRLNVAGREGKGIIPPEQYASSVSELCALLEKLPGVARAVPRDTVYKGAFADRAADIFLELDWSTGYRASVIRKRGGAAVEVLQPEAYKGGKEQGCAGVHRNPAFLASSRPLTRKNPAMEDIAPAVLSWLGITYEGMEGKSFLESQVQEETVCPADWIKASEKKYTEEEESLLEKRMKALGYFE
ncbi:MAG TPA: alkaline phosphatase family protein [Candidatus Hydrogenedentes bacterium]|nr:alkaline phosphatase family protein [Candidatus Hydrogenedentota bacterium]HOR51267.1 alkaline phosphatase family protein [Candidatus Hydrogenedentota bacterium]HPK25171.1 alkaline phosphatase family protein [Candidatus Hydrogenedentota bacterium]